MKNKLITSFLAIAMTLSITPIYANQKQDFINTVISENLNYYQNGVGVDVSTGLPYDHITYDGNKIIEVGKFDNPTTIGFYLNAMVLISLNNAKSSSISHGQAFKRINKALDQLLILQNDKNKNWKGLFYWYSLEDNKITPKDGVISSVDNANLAFSLAGVIGAYQDLDNPMTRDIVTKARKILKNQLDGWYDLYDPQGEGGKGMMYAGYDTDQNAPLGYHVDRVLNESRLVPVWAILTNSMRPADKQVPLDAFTNMVKTTTNYTLSTEEQIKGITMTWDGTVFQELLPAILVNEAKISSFMKQNHQDLVTIQTDYAKTHNIPALLSASSTANAGHETTINGQNDYASFGVPGVSESYISFKNDPPRHDTGTPHASALTYLVNHDTAFDLLNNLKTNYSGIVSNYGWYDAIGYSSLGQTVPTNSLTILGLDQGMLVLALTDNTTSNYVEKYLKSVDQYNQLKEIYATLDN